MTILCACKSHDEWLCWSIRYGIELSEVEQDGGPCECVCHEEEHED